jgi:hypothetical protein
MLKIDRATLAKFLPNPQAIAAFEGMFKEVGQSLPDTVEAANALAAQALATAAQALAMLAELHVALEQLASAPAAPPLTESDHDAPVTIPTAEADDLAPRPHMGTISTQNHDAVDIAGGTIAGLTSLAMASGVTLANNGALSGLLSLATSSGITLSSTGKLTLNKALAGDVIANLVNLDPGGFGLRVAGGANGASYVASFNLYDGTNVALLSGNGNLALNSLTVSGPAPNPGATKVSFGSVTATTVGAAGAAAALPATPAGYLIFNNGGTNYKLPFYNA